MSAELHDFDWFVDRLEVARWTNETRGTRDAMTSCPVCSSRDNLHITEKNGKALVAPCFGCGVGYNEVVAALIEEIPQPKTTHGRTKRTPRSTEARVPYPAYGPNGALIANQLKAPTGVEPKYKWDRTGVAPDDLHGGLATITYLPAGTRVVVVEGHGPAKALNDVGIPAVCTVTGKGSKRGKAGWNDRGAGFLYGYPAVLVPDIGGEGHMDATGAIIAKATSDVFAVAWPADAGLRDNEDAAQFIERHGADAMRALIEQAPAWTPPKIALRHVLGGEFVFGEDEVSDALWGNGDQILWAPGESLMLAGGIGAGKSTVLQQLIFHGIGILDGPFLGYNVNFRPGTVVGYIAADRPKQVRRSMRRMVPPLYLELANARLDVWRGPLPFELVKADVGALADFVDDRGWDIVAIDSLKDVASNVSEDSPGLAINSQFQELLARDKELIFNHHDRKSGEGKKRRTTRLDDVYGSRWLTGGVGSTVYLDGEPGSDTVDMVHLKQPAEVVGPFTLRHDHAAGTTVVEGAPVITRSRAPKSGVPEVVAALVAAGGRATAQALGKALSIGPRQAQNYLKEAASQGLVMELPRANVRESVVWAVTES